MRERDVDAYKVLEMARDYLTNFISKDKGPTDYLLTRMTEIAAARLMGRGGYIVLPSGKKILYSIIRRYVDYCGTKDGPLDYMDETVHGFTVKHADTMEDRKFLDDICYDVNTLS